MTKIKTDANNVYTSIPSKSSARRIYGDVISHKGKYYENIRHSNKEITFHIESKCNDNNERFQSESDIEILTVSEI